MSGPNESDGRPGAAADSQSVLANLPRTRPQRSTPRRAAARKAAAGNGVVRLAPAPVPNGAAKAASTGAQAPANADPKRKPQAASNASRKRARSAPKRPATSRPDREPVPRQGFECDGESARGPVQPPGGAELLTSALEIAGELAKAGISTGERLLRDAISRLSPS